MGGSSAQNGDYWRCNDDYRELEYGPHGYYPFSVSGSVLTNTARHEDPHAIDPATPNPLPSGNTGTYTAGTLSSHPGFQLTYGYIEGRIQIPAGVAGAWPAFWMVSATTVWPPEFDIQEYSSGSNTASVWWSEQAGEPGLRTSEPWCLGWRLAHLRDALVTR